MPQCGHEPVVAGLPFFRVTSVAFDMSLLTLHLKQYAWVTTVRSSLIDSKHFNIGNGTFGAPVAVLVLD